MAPDIPVSAPISNYALKSEVAIALFVAIFCSLHNITNMQETKYWLESSLTIPWRSLGNSGEVLEKLWI